MIKEIPLWKIKLLFGIDGNITKVQINNNKLCIQFKPYKKLPKKGEQISKEHFNQDG